MLAWLLAPGELELLRCESCDGVDPLNATPFSLRIAALPSLTAPLTLLCRLLLFRAEDEAV